MNKLKGLSVLPGVRWTVFTIAVQDPTVTNRITFPAEFIVDIYKRYHNAENLFMPRVFTCGGKDEIEAVLEEAAQWAYTVDHSRTQSPFDPVKTPFSQLKNCASCFLNMANNSNMFVEDQEQYIQNLEFSLESVHKVRQRAEELYKASHAEPLSVFDEGYVGHVTKDAYSSTMQHVLWIISRIKDLINDAQMNKLLCNMDRTELTLALSHMEFKEGSGKEGSGSVFGKFFAKAAELRKPPPTEAVVLSLKKFLNETLPREQKGGIHSCKLGDDSFRRMLDESMHSLHLCNSVQDMLLRIPFPALVLTIDKRPDQLDFDSFCLRGRIEWRENGEVVCNKPSFMRSDDFFNDRHERKTDQVLVPLLHIPGQPWPELPKTSSPEDFGKDCFYATTAAKAMLSFALTLNPVINHAQAAVGLLGTALRCTLEQTRDEGLKALQRSLEFTLDVVLHDGSNAMSPLLLYIKALSGFDPESVRNCLTTESAELPNEFKCPSFGKFLMALVQIVAQGGKPTVDQFMAIKRMWIIEALGRSETVGADFSFFLLCKEVRTMGDILDSVLDAVRKDHPHFQTLREAEERFMGAVHALRVDSLGLAGLTEGAGKLTLDTGAVVQTKVVTMDTNEIDVHFPGFDYHVSVCECCVLFVCFIFGYAVLSSLLVFCFFPDTGFGTQGWTVAKICRTLYNLALDAGHPREECDCVLALFWSKEELLHMLDCARVNNSFERCNKAMELSLPDMNLVGRQIASGRKKRLLAQAKELFETKIKPEYLQSLRDTHQGIPTPLTEEMLDLFREQHPDVDISGLKVSKTGLGLNCCNFHKCPFFLKPMGDPAKAVIDGKTQEVLAQPSMSAVLREHLFELDIVPCMHKAVVKSKEAKAKFVPETLAKEIISGEHIESLGNRNCERFDKTLDTTKLHIASCAGGDETWLPQMLARIKKSYEFDVAHYNKHVAPALLVHYATWQEASVPV